MDVPTDFAAVTRRTLPAKVMPAYVASDMLDSLDHIASELDTAIQDGAIPFDQWRRLIHVKTRITELRRQLRRACLSDIAVEQIP